MVSKKQIATGLAAIAVSLTSNYAQGAEEVQLKIADGPAVIDVPGLNKNRATISAVPATSTKMAPPAVSKPAETIKPISEDQKAVLPESKRVKATIKAVESKKETLKPTKKLSKVICTGPNDTLSFSNPPKKKFGNSKNLKDCGSKELYKSNVATLMSSNYGKSWQNMKYSVGPISTPVFTSTGKTFADDLANIYHNSISDKILVYKMGGEKIGPKAQLNSIIKAQNITSTSYPLVDLTKEVKEVLNNSKGKYVFDIDGNGKQNELNLVQKNGKVYVIDFENGSVLSEKPLDNVRYEILSNIRNVEGGQTDASRGYLMTFGNNGKDVIRFMVDTNKVANETLVENAYIPTEQTKFKNLEGLVTFTDKVANLSERADQINAKVLKYIADGKIQIDTKQIDMKAYSSTFGEEVPVGIVALYFTAGSAIYTVLNSDYLPTVKGSEVMAQVRGSRDAVNLEMLTLAHKNNVDLSQTAVNAYTQTKSMYNAQFKASEKKVTEVKF